MAGGVGPSALWYLTRGTGAVTLVLLTASVAIGVANVRRTQTERVPRFVVDAVHRSASLLALASSRSTSSPPCSIRSPRSD